MFGLHRPFPAAGAVAALLLSGCAVGPDFKRPAVAPQADYSAGTLPEKLGGAATTGGGVQALAIGQDISGQWWTLFHAPRLNALIDQALAHNPTLVAAQYTLLQARETTRAAEGGLLPAIDAAFGATRQKVSASEYGAVATGTTMTTGSTTGSSTTTGTSTIPTAGNATYDLFNAQVSVSYNLDIWGQVQRTVEQTRAQEEYQRYALEAAYLTLTSNIVAAAVAEASLQAQIGATQQVIAAEQNGLNIVNVQLAAGGITRSVVLQQQAQLQQSEATLPPLQSQLAQERNLLATYLGVYPGQYTAPSFDLAEITLPTELPVSLPSALVDQRPDIRQAEATLHGDTAAIGIATANMLPAVTLTGAYGSDATKLTDLFAAGSFFYSLGAEITQKLFEGGTLLHQRRAAVAGAEAAAAQYKATVQNAFANVSDALLALQYDAAGLQVALAAAQSASESLKLQQVQYQAGATSSLTVLTAQQTDQNALIILARAQAARYADTAALFQALGGGWWNRQDVRPKTMKCCGLLQ